MQQDTKRRTRKAFDGATIDEVAAQAEQAKRKITVTPVYGPMHHLLLDVRIEGPTEFDEIDSFLQAQIDAGKLRLC